jgi:thioredoxin reductase
MHDVIIIGGSFAGLAAALQLARARRNVLVADAGQPRNRFASHAHGFLGQDGRPPRALLDEARRQLLAYPSVRLRAGEVTAVVGALDRFVVTFADGEPALARRLILATGVADLLPDVPGLRERWGEGVVHCPYCHAYELADKRLGILATGPAALHQAQMLPDWSSRVTLFTNGAIAPSAEERDALERRNVRVAETPVVEVLGTERSVDAVRLADGALVPIDGLFVAAQTTLATPFAERLGCAIEAGPQGPLIATDLFKATTVAGVFAAGDAARQPHSISLAVADGAMAGIGAHRSLFTAAVPPDLNAHREATTHP